MSDPDKKPDDENNPFESMKGFLKDSFEQARANTGEALDVASRSARNTLKTGEKAAHEAYAFVERTVGKERIIGAVLGAKAGGTVGMVAGVPGIIKGGIVGAAAGFVGGRKFVDWYKRDDAANDTVQKAETLPDKPKDPAP